MRGQTRDGQKSKVEGSLLLKPGLFSFDSITRTPDVQKRTGKDALLPTWHLISSSSSQMERRLRCNINANPSSYCEHLEGLDFLGTTGFDFTQSFDRWDGFDYSTMLGNKLLVIEWFFFFFFQREWVEFNDCSISNILEQLIKDLMRSEVECSIQMSDYK